MECEQVVFSGHAIQRMFQRGIGLDAVLAVVAQGETVAAYADDKPYRSRLLLGFVDAKPLHVVVAFDESMGACIVVTAYETSARTMGSGLQDKEESMSCVICRNGKTHNGHVTVTVQRGETTVILKRVPAEVCDNCAEYYLSSEVAAQVLERAESAVKSGAEVEILRFAA